MPKFNLMSYIMPPEDKMFFTYFQESAEICLKTAKLYDEIMHNHLNDEYKEKALKYKRKGKLSYKACLKQLNKSFITPIEREDIQTIAVQLNKITKKIVKACLNLEVYRLDNYTDEMKEQALTLVQATEKLGEIIKQFKKVSKNISLFYKKTRLIFIKNTKVKNSDKFRFFIISICPSIIKNYTLFRYGRE